LNSYGSCSLPDSQHSERGLKAQADPTKAAHPAKCLVVGGANRRSGAAIFSPALASTTWRGRCRGGRTAGNCYFGDRAAAPRRRRDSPALSTAGDHLSLWRANSPIDSCL